jgi:uncharacterized protein YdeI (YjbR/CyaY-like superfamily)
MGKKNKFIDDYINNAEPFARPILLHLRNLVHQACPEVEESLKWKFPHFGYKGMMCGMASFQKHCVFGFWKSALLKDPHNVLGKTEENAMGQFGRITCRSDLPSDEIIIAYIHEAMQLNDQGIKLPKKSAVQKPQLVIPEYFLLALKKNKQALNTFENFPPSKKRDYVEWITEAKQEATREKRMATAVEWLSEGKSRNWKYEKCS